MHDLAVEDTSQHKTSCSETKRKLIIQLSTDIAVLLQHVPEKENDRTARVANSSHGTECRLHCHHDTHIVACYVIYGNRHQKLVYIC